jgi:hypothetical protein
MVLSNNQLINIILEGIESVDSDTIESIDYSFSTTFSPLYSTPNKIRAVVGSYVQDISDEMLLYLIHTFSVDADNLSICDHVAFPKWDYYAGQWVAYSAALEAVMNSDLYVNTSGQKTYKKLGDFSISKDNSAPGSNPSQMMVGKLECELLKLSVAIKFCKEPLTSCDKGLVGNDLRNGVAAKLVLKGEFQAKPLIGRTFIQSGRYPAMTGFIKLYDKYKMTNDTPRYRGIPLVDDNGRYH